MINKFRWVRGDPSPNRVCCTDRAALSRKGRGRHNKRLSYSALNPAALMIGPHLVISAWKNAAHCSGELPIGT
jgi:hypothetical protein